MLLRIRLIAVIAFFWVIGFSAATAARLTVAPQQLIQKAGNTEDDRERLALLKQLCAEPGLEPALRQEAEALVRFTERWLDDPRLENWWDQAILKNFQPPFSVALDSPLYPLAEFYRGRMITWAALEYGGVRSDAKQRRSFFDEARKAFALASRAFPQNRVCRMYLGEPIPWEKSLPAPEGAPRWAVLQRECLERLSDIVSWWVDNRERKDNSYGGGWNDDCEMWRWWAPVLVGFDEPKFIRAQERLSNALLGAPHMKGGYTSKLDDVEHTAEDSADTITPMMLLAPHDESWIRRVRRLQELFGGWTAANSQGRRQFRSFHFSSEAVSPDPVFAYDTPPNVRAIQPLLVFWQRTGDPVAGKLITAWLDTWVEATASDRDGKPGGVLPNAIHWPDGRLSGETGNWWSFIPQGERMWYYYVFPQAVPELADALLLSWNITKEDRYLQPLRSMAKVRREWLKRASDQPDPAPGTRLWAAKNLDGLAGTLAKYKLLTGNSEFDDVLAADLPEFSVAAGEDRTRLIAAFGQAAAALRVNWAGYTSEVRYTDRVIRFSSIFSQSDNMLPGTSDPKIADFKSLPLYAAVTGDPSQVMGSFPLNAVRWLTSARDLGALVVSSSSTRFGAELYHFGAAARPMAARLHLLTPGKYSWILRNRTGKIADGPLLMQPGEGEIHFVLPPQTLCFLDVVQDRSKSLQTEPSLDFIHITDTHVSRNEGVHPKIVAARAGHSQAGENLASLLDQLQTKIHAGFVVHTGDAIDAYCFDGAASVPVGEQIEHFHTMIERLPLPVHIALGNHDIQCYRRFEGRDSPYADQSVAARARRAWQNAFDCFKEGRTFYSVSHQVGSANYRFLVLDNGENHSSGFSFYQEQFAWLKEQLTRNRTDPTILAMHVPLGDNKFSEEVKTLLAQADNVVLSLAGHRHTDALEEISLGKRSLPQVQTAALSLAADNWRRIRLYEDRIEVSETGRPEQIARIVPVGRRIPGSAGILPALGPQAGFLRSQGPGL